MKEVIGDKHFSEDEKVPAQPVRDKPSEIEMASLTLLMRLYDVGMAILTHLDEERANQIYEAHERGETFNPDIYIPELEE